jgi:phosphotransacetylase
VLFRSVALKGRVPVRVIGGCSKGDQMAPYGNGLGASVTVTFPGAQVQPIVFAVALEDCATTEETLVECVIL